MFDSCILACEYALRLPPLSPHGRSRRALTWQRLRRLTIVRRRHAVYQCLIMYVVPLHSYRTQIHRPPFYSESPRGVYRACPVRVGCEG